jgi:transcriptional regulator with XRE-family HTH domain
MELVQPLESLVDESPRAPALQPAPAREDSPLARARLQRQLTRETAAERAGISEEEATWLEEGRVYRFPSADDALLATLLYATSLGIDNREARELAGLPGPALPARRHSMRRALVLVSVLGALGLLGALFLVTHAGGGNQQASRSDAAVLPPPWRIPVTVLNGSGDINFTRVVASHIQSFGYTIKHVGRADRFTYLQTAVYFPPRCEGVAMRLAKQLGTPAKPLPGGSGPCKLWVIAGPARGPGN